MPEPLIPATLSSAADGTPFAPAYDDVYHSAAGGLRQARHVFLQGNGLPARWRDRRGFTILETGFGFGLSFLATWRAWREDPARCGRLHFVSIEKHPFAGVDLEVLLQLFPEARKESKQLLAAWPMLVPGMHRIEFEAGKVVLTLCFGDIADALPQLQLAADAIYLDGFAPPKNPEMWSAPLLRHLGRLAAPGATLATWSVAASVRSALQGAGFALEKTAGFGTKREMLLGHLARAERAKPVPFRQSAIVIGAGVAGAAVCERLASRGWRVALIERHAAAAQEASGNPAGVFHPVVSPDDSLFARFTRASFLYLLRHWQSLDGVEWARCGVLQMARNRDEAQSQRRALATLRYPANYAQFDEAKGGVWYADGGWVRPRSLVEGLLSRFHVERHFNREVAALTFEGEWHARDIEGKAIASAPVVVLANAAEALRFSPRPEARLRRVRGQLSLVPAIAGLNHVLLRGGMALPGAGGVSVIGASFDIDDDDPEPRADSHAGNLERLEQMLPGALAGFNPRLDPSKLDGRVAFRAVVPDRMPMVGRLGNGLFGAFAFGSRGLLWASLAGEIIASKLQNEPLPVERKLVAAVDPERFSIRAKRRNYGRSSSTSS